MIRIRRHRVLVFGRRETRGGEIHISLFFRLCVRHERVIRSIGVLLRGDRPIQAFEVSQVLMGGGYWNLLSAGVISSDG